MNGPNNNIGWCDYTWNPITGCVGNKESGCYEYCYARALYQRFGWDFKPKFHLNRIKEPRQVKEPSRIFVCSVSDIFSKSVKDEWRTKVFQVIQENPQHIFQILTKCPENIIKNSPFPDNVWLGVTITKGNEFHRIVELSDVYCKIKFVSIEPMTEKISLCCEPPIDNLIDWIIIGAQTGPNSVPIQKEWVYDLIKRNHNRLPIYVKDNVKFYQEYKEFPK